MVVIFKESPECWSELHLNTIIFFGHCFCSNGSIINDLGLGFASTSVPNNTQIANTLIDAASNITAFNIDTTSISVDGTRKKYLMSPHQKCNI